MSSIPVWPTFAPITLEMAREITPRLLQLPDGISEYSFAGLYLFRDRYNYQVSLYEDLLIISGCREGQRFFITPCCRVGEQVLSELFKTHQYWKLVSPSFVAANEFFFDSTGWQVEEDRDNFDYLYLRTELAALSGKKFHKKKNHINGFLLSYPDFHVRDLGPDTREDARIVLEDWGRKELNPEQTDLSASHEALDLLEFFDMRGQVLYVGDVPVAWCLAEPVADGRIVAVHFEKARTDIRGAYQFINYCFARSLPDTVDYINREQDLGDEGMRQAKMSYRPAGFVRKYRVYPRQV